MPITCTAMRVSSLVVALLMALAWANPARAGAAADFGVQLPRQQKPAPAFALADLHGEAVSLQSLRGKVVLLHFWATWCVACRHEMPKVERLWQQYRRQGLVVLAVNVDRGGADSVRDYVREYGLSFPVVLDPQGELRNRYAVRALPTTYVIGRKGRILGRIFGARDWGSPNAQVWIDALLNDT